MTNMKRIQGWLLSLFVVISAATFSTLFIYFRNIKEVAIKEVLSPFLIFACISGISLLVFAKIMNSKDKSTIFTVALALLLTNYVFIENAIRKIIHIFKYWHVVIILLFVLIHLAWFIKTKINSRELLDTITQVCAIVFLVLILINAIPQIPKGISKLKAASVNSINQSNQMMPSANLNKNPNIYYLLFDEYSSFDTIKECYDYDNSNLHEFLTNLGFAISDSSHNETIYTDIVMTNILSLGFAVNEQSEDSKKAEYRANSKLFSILEKYGYKIRTLGETDFIGRPASAVFASETAKTIEGDTAASLIMKNTVFYPFYSNVNSEEATNILNTLGYFQKSDIYQDKGIFTMMHLTSPHAPFLFDQNGGKVKDSEYANWNEKEYYLNQFIFITKKMKETIDSIVSNDPQSIIILQSDHSARFGPQEILFEQKTEILNAVYYMGEDIKDIEGMSGMDTIIYTLNLLLNADLPMGGYQYAA